MAVDFRLDFTGPDVVYGYGLGVNPETNQWNQPSSQGGGDTDIAFDPATQMTAYEKALLAQSNAQEEKRQANASQVMKALLDQYNMSSLYSTVVNFIKDGYDPDAIMFLIRTTPEYKQRFPAMEALAAKGRAMSEGEYVAYENAAAGLERRYGMPEGMLMGNVTKFLTNEVSASELNDRVMLASAAAIQAPQELKDQFQQYYGIDSGGMTAYFFDPDVATPLLEKQYASSLIGMEATRQGVGLDVFGAENLQGLGITQERAREGFGTVASARSLTQGRGDTVSQENLIKGTLADDQKAQQEIQRAAAGRLGRFQGGGEFLQTSQGNVGLGKSTTR